MAIGQNGRIPEVAYGDGGPVEGEEGAAEEVEDVD